MSQTTGEQIRAIRASRGESQETVARRADISTHTLIRIENGQTPTPTLETLRKLASALGVPLEDLITTSAA